VGGKRGEPSRGAEAKEGKNIPPHLARESQQEPGFVHVPLWKADKKNQALARSKLGIIKADASQSTSKRGGIVKTRESKKRLEGSKVQKNEVAYRGEMKNSRGSERSRVGRKAETKVENGHASTSQWGLERGGRHYLIQESFNIEKNALEEAHRKQRKKKPAGLQVPCWVSQGGKNTRGGASGQRLKAQSGPLGDIPCKDKRSGRNRWVKRHGWQAQGSGSTSGVKSTETARFQKQTRLETEKRTRQPIVGGQGPKKRAKGDQPKTT